MRWREAAVAIAIVFAWAVISAPPVVSILDHRASATGAP